MSRFPLSRRAGFSLIEVVLALGLAAFCLVTLLALLPVGMKGDRTTLQQTVAANIANAAVIDLRSAPLNTDSYAPKRTLYSPRFRFSLPMGGAEPQTIFVTDEGVPLTAPNSDLPLTTPGSVYRVSIFGAPRSVGATPQRTASLLYILITWPGQADPSASGSSWPSHYAGSFETVAYLDQN